MIEASFSAKEQSFSGLQGITADRAGPFSANPNRGASNSITKNLLDLEEI